MSASLAGPHGAHIEFPSNEPTGRTNRWLHWSLQKDGINLIDRMLAIGEVIQPTTSDFMLLQVKWGRLPIDHHGVIQLACRNILYEGPCIWCMLCTA